ncbi:MAG TPA: MFS transporter, partial [Planctomycetaceae bacterium]|nr:MFS transporter [Planctomycetaceae bacterium]
TDVVRLDPRLVGYAFAIRFFFDAASDPAMGFLSDRTASPLGRRRPFFLLGAIPAALAFYLLLAPPAAGETATFLYLTVTSSGLILSLTIFGIPYYALSWELTSNYDERTRIAAYRRFVEVGAEVLATMSIPLLLTVLAEDQADSSFAAARIYPTAAVLIGAVAVVAAFITFFGTTETRRRESRTSAGFLASMRAAAENKPFVILLATFTLVAAADQVVTSLLFFVMEHLHGVPKQDANSLFLAFFLGSLASPALWLLLGKRIGKKRAYVLALCCWGATFTAFAITTWPPTTLHGIALLMGASSSGVFLLPDAILPDVIEWEQIRTGERREGIYAGIATFFRKLGTGGCFLVVGHLLHAIDYVGGTPPTPNVLTGLRIIFIGLPGALLAAALLVFRFYPITAGAFRRMVGDLESRGESAVETGTPE